MKMTSIRSTFAAALVVAGASAQASTLPGGWVANGNAGVGFPDGVVTTVPGPESQYFWISTHNAPSGVGQLPAVEGTNGTLLTSPSFSAQAGSLLSYYFNYVTSDGHQFADYAWAALQHVGSGVDPLILFTARTAPEGAIVPGFDLPDIAPGVTLDPASVEITAGTDWTPLGPSSGTCYGPGCGHTGWVNATYEIPEAGLYRLLFGVTNYLDEAYDSGLAIAGATIDGELIAPIPLPAAGWLLLGGIAGMAFLRRRPKHETAA
jgi:hypothetical protein